MDCVELLSPISWATGPVEIFHRIGLVELERVMRLRHDIYADHVEASAVIAHGRAAGAAEQVEQARTAHRRAVAGARQRITSCQPALACSAGSRAASRWR